MYIELCNKKHLRLVCLLFIYSLGELLIPTAALSQITVDQMIFDFTPKSKPVKNIVVINSSDKSVSVRVEPVQVTNPGDEEEKLLPTSDILISPKRFSVPPNGQRTVRLLIKKLTVDTEQVYRASFIPEARELGEDEQGERNEPNEGSNNEPKMVLRVLTGVGILIFVNPLKPIENITWKRTESTVTINNEGNFNVMLVKIKSCKREDSNSCENLVPKRLYAGNHLVFPLNSDRILHLRKQVGEKVTEITIN